LTTQFPEGYQVTCSGFVVDNQLFVFVLVRISVAVQVVIAWVVLEWLMQELPKFSNKTGN